MASSSVSAFSPVRNASTSSDDADGKTMIHFPKTDLTYTTHSYAPWWNGESSVGRSPIWPWWGLQNQRFPNLYRFHQFSGVADDEKPAQSYIGLIAEAILSCPEEKLILSDIYGFILANYPYFRNKGTGWRNSIRHNLSLNDCFVKAGRSQNGKGHFWAIGHLYIDDFRRGDFRRKRTYRRPSRSKKAKAKLEALKQKEKQDEKMQDAGTVSNSDDNQPSASEMRIVLRTEQSDSKNDVPESPTIQQDTNISYKAEKQNERDEDSVCVVKERVASNSPEVEQPADNEIAVCKDENDNEQPSATNSRHDEDDIDYRREIAELRASRRPFDMAALLAPERTPQNVGILREMYPMYYNIMNLGMRALDTTNLYSASSGYCSHCVSVLRPFHSQHNRPVYSVADYSTGQTRNEGQRRESME